MSFYETLASQYNDFLVIFARVSGVIAFAPVLGANNLPNVVKIWLSFTLSLLATSILSPLPVQANQDTIGLMMQLAVEASIGAAIGFAATIFFEMVTFAGYIMDYMIGFGFINIVDPQSGASVSILGFFYGFLTLLIFLLIDGHHIIIEALVRSYEFIPVFGASLSEFSFDYITRLTAEVINTGFRIASPIFVVMFVVDFSLGVIGKTVPQLQILVVGFPIKIGIGLSAVGIAIKTTSGFLIHLLGDYRETLFWVIHHFGGGS